MDAPYYRWRPHPWHGLGVGPDPPGRVHAFIEICPFDLVKYEVDKVSGYMRVDRPNRTSSQPPTLYGFIPRTLSDVRVAALMEGSLRGDGDPLDICVLSERPIARAEIILTARVVGGLPMLDHGEADDKIVAVLDSDPVWEPVRDLADVPPVLVDRLRHYFLTYKLDPKRPGNVSMGEPYDRAYALRVIAASMEDYAATFHDRAGEDGP
jgi:inorganic pyrophosphatase